LCALPGLFLRCVLMTLRRSLLLLLRLLCLMSIRLLRLFLLGRLA
jgi:hypothetical protein